MNTLQQAFGHLAGGRVLDVATGNGNFVGILSEHLREYTEIIGVDTNARALDAARKNFTQANIHFQTMDAARLDFSDASFDTVNIAYSLHHLENLAQAFTEMRRVLKPGGHFIIAEMVCDHQTETQLTHVYLHHWWAAIDTALGNLHRETFTRQHILDLVAELNLRDCRFYDYADLARDPFDAENRIRLDAAIDLYGERAQSLPNALALCARGEELRARVCTIGFHSATILIVIGKK